MSQQQAYTGNLGITLTVPEGLYFPNQHPDHTNTPDSVWGEVARVIREYLEGIGAEVNGVFHYATPYKHPYTPQVQSKHIINQDITHH